MIADKDGRIQIGQQAVATKNFVLDSTAADGTMKLARGNAGATTQDLITVAADGNVQLTKTSSQSMVRLNTSNGYGSTNTKIRRFTNVVTNQGTDITYADSATLGASFTINTAGVYAITYSEAMATTADQVGISLNTTTPTTNIASCAVGEVLAYDYAGSANYGASASWVGYLAAGSVVRAHTNGGSNAAPPQFTITRVA